MPTILEDEYISLNSWVFATPACGIDGGAGGGLGPVWTLPNIKGDDFAGAGQDGDTPRENNFTAIRFQLKVIIYGEADEDGNAYADIRDGIRQNLAAMWTAIKPNTSSPYTRTMNHVLTNGGTRSAAAKVVGIGPSVGKGPTAISFGLDFKIPSGSWSYTAP